MPERIDVSVIIVNYNEDELLRQCISSIIRLTSSVSYEIIVVDNGSTKGNVAEIISKFESVNLIRNGKNLGFGAANNIGLKHSHGKYILFLNNDTKLLTNTIKDMYDFSEQLRLPVFAGCRLLNSDMTRQESVFDFPSLWNNFTENFFLYKIFPKSKLFNKYYQNYHEYENPLEVDVIQGAFMFCPAEEIRKLNGFDERFFFYSEETDLCCRFRKTGGKIFVLPNISIIHYGGATTDKNLWFKYKNQSIGKIQYYQKHFHGINYLFAILFHFLGLFLRWVQNSIAGLFMFRKNLLIKGYYFLRQMFVYPKNLFRRTV